MAEPTTTTTVPAGSVIHICSAGSGFAGTFLRVVLGLVLLASLGLNVVLLIALMTLHMVKSGLPSGQNITETVLRAGGQDKIAVIPIDGTIDGATASAVQKDVYLIRHSPDIRAVVLRVDSPGGGVSDADEIYHALDGLKALNKPVVVSMGAMAASGAYYISMAGRQLFAEPTTVTGSIGVMLPGFQITSLLKKIGVKPEVLTSTPAVWKEAGAPWSTYTPAVKSYLIDLLNSDDARFEAVIQKSRGSRLDEPVANIANGKVWTAQKALEKGLVDHIGYESAAIHAAAKLADIYHPTVVELSPNQGLLSLIKVQSAVSGMKMQISPRLVTQMLSPKFEYLYVP